MKTGIWWTALTVAALAAGPAWPIGDNEDDGVEATESTEMDEGSATADAVFEFLTAEIASQRGDSQSSIAIYHRMARELKDPNIARRAIELAIRTRDFPAALEGASLLLELEPDSPLAREILAALIGSDNDLGKAAEHAAALVKKSEQRAPLLMNMAQMFGKFPDKAAVLQVTRKIAADYSSQPEAHYAIGVAALLANNESVAIAEADRALSMRRGWDQGAILKGQVLRRGSPEKVIAFYRTFLEQYPDATETRMQLGRELATDRQLEAARAEFRDVEKRAPHESQAPYAVGLLSLQLEDYAEAQTAFTRALKQGYREPAAIYLGMGQASEGLKQYEDAISWYQKVDSNDWVRAQLKIATLIAREQGLEAGREYLHRVEVKSSADKVQVVQVEAQLLREAKRWEETFQLLTRASAENPNSYELLYDRAMAAERIERLDVVESDLRKVIAMKPDYAHAYNALGYTLAEKTDRLAEARELVEKALKLAPEDPFILDSLGWVHYRMGNMPDALRLLHQAYGSRPDPEIAAHLGEALWKSGQPDEARKVWKAALSENPNHEALLSLMAKYH